MAGEMRIESLNLDGLGDKPTKVYCMESKSAFDFWASVTDVTCPACNEGVAQWSEAGHVPGHRTCNNCGTTFLAQGTALEPQLAVLED